MAKLFENHPDNNRTMLRLMSQASRSKIVRWIDKIHKASNGWIPHWLVGYRSYNHFTRCHIFEIRMPVTDGWESVLVSDQHFAAGCIPKALSEQIDYFIKMRKLIERARDYSPMNRDLSPISAEEKSIFGVYQGAAIRRAPVRYILQMDL